MMSLPRLMLSIFTALCAVTAVAQTAAAASSAPPVAVNIVTGAQLVAAGEREAQRAVHDRNHGVIALGGSDQRLGPGSVTLHAEPAQRFGDSYLNVPVTIAVNGRAVRSVLIGFRIASYTDRVVAVHDLHPGDVLDASDFTTRRVLDGGAPGPLLQQFTGRVVASDIPAGQVAQLWQTTVRELVHGGQPVVLIVRDGGVALADDVVARTSGALGDSVMVYDERDDRTISAIVTAPGQVELTLPQIGDS